MPPIFAWPFHYGWKFVAPNRDHPKAVGSEKLKEKLFPAGERKTAVIFTLCPVTLYPFITVLLSSETNMSRDVSTWRILTIPPEIRQVLQSDSYAQHTLVSQQLCAMQSQKGLCLSCQPPIVRQVLHSERSTLALKHELRHQKSKTRMLSVTPQKGTNVLLV